MLEVASPRLRSALVAYYGHERGSDAYSEALLYSWENQSKVLALTDPIPYLFRVGQSRTRRRRLPLALPPPEQQSPDFQIPRIEPGLHPALMQLTRQQRTAVVLIFGWQWSYSEVAQLLGISKGSVQRHADRGMAKLRYEMGR